MNELYLRYPAEELKKWIESINYKPKTSMDNLMCMVFLHFDGELDGDDEYYADKTEPYMNRLIAYVSDCGINEFDYIP